MSDLHEIDALIRMNYEQFQYWENQSPGNPQADHYADQVAFWALMLMYERQQIEIAALKAQIAALKAAQPPPD